MDDGACGSDREDEGAIVLVGDDGKTDEALFPDNVYNMSGNKICVRTLDLNQEFSEIRRQLDEIVKEYFPEK